MVDCELRKQDKQSQERGSGRRRQDLAYITEIPRDGRAVRRNPEMWFESHKKPRTLETGLRIRSDLAPKLQEIRNHDKASKID